MFVALCEGSNRSDLSRIPFEPDIPSRMLEDRPAMPFRERPTRQVLTDFSDLTDKNGGSSHQS